MRVSRYAARALCVLAILPFLSQSGHSAICTANNIAGAGGTLGCAGVGVVAGSRSNSFGPFSYAHNGSYATQGAVDIQVISPPAGNPATRVSVVGSAAAAADTSISTPGGIFSTSASADLQSGILRVSSLGTDLAGSAASSAQVHDILSISIPKWIVNPLLRFKLDIDGMISLSGGPAPVVSPLAQGQLLITNPSNGLLYDGLRLFAAQSIGTFDTSLTTTIDDLRWAVDKGDSWLLTVGLTAILFAGNDGGYSVDFSHSATLGLEFSPGITFSSESGLLLVDPGTPADVPEPSSVWLALMAALPLYGSRRPALMRRLRFRA